MDGFIRRIPELEHRVYVLSGPRPLVTLAAMRLVLRETDRFYLSTEWICLKEDPERLRRKFLETAAECRQDPGAHACFHRPGCGSVAAVCRRLRASWRRRFVRLAVVDSLESLCAEGVASDADEVFSRLRALGLGPVIVLSEEEDPEDASVVMFSEL